MKKHRSEHGQVLVLIVLAMAAMLGFAALAVDGGQLYAERRRAQNAADAAALAAGKAAIDFKDHLAIHAIVTKLIQSNGYFEDGAKTVVDYYNPPISGPYTGNSEYHQVIIQRDVAPIFAHLFFNGNPSVKVEAVTRALPAENEDAGNVVHGLKSTTGDSVEADGNVKVSVHHGNVYSNAAGDKAGSATHGYLVVDEGGKIITRDGWDNTDKIFGDMGMTTPATYASGPAIMPPEIPQPYCPGSTMTTADGIYYWVGNARDVPNPTPQGVYCLTGGALKHSIVGNQILLVLLGDSSIEMTGGDTMNVTPWQKLIVKNIHNEDYTYNGLLIWSDPNAPYSSSRKLMLGGNSNNWINGTIYAPKIGCSIGGTSNVEVSTRVENAAHHTQLICYTVKFHGTSLVDIDYDDAILFHQKPDLSLAQ